MAVIQYHIEALGSGRTYDLLTYYNHISKVNEWCKVTFGDIHRSGWWWQTIPRDYDTVTRFYFREYSDYILFKMTWGYDEQYNYDQRC